MAYFIPTFDILISDDRKSLIIADNQRHWDSVIDSDWSIKVVSEYSDIEVSINKTITREDLGLETTDIKEDFEIEIPAELLIDDAEYVPDSIYNVTIQLVESDVVVASIEDKEVIYEEATGYVAEKAMSLRVAYIKIENSEPVVNNQALIIKLEYCADMQSADGEVIEILEYFKDLISGND